MNYQEALTVLEDLSVFGVRQGLERIKRLLELLDNPQEKFRSIHVTGTNGKGSVSIMLAGIFRQADILAGLFISPHLESYTERIRIHGKNIEEQVFADLLEAVMQKVALMKEEGMECPTQFEVLTAMGFLHFAKSKVEYAVIEVGLGGLLDSTNVITPEISVITNVSLEHAELCGGSLEGIARHKAGIIKEGIPVITGADRDVLEIIRKEAESKNADLFVLGEDFSVSLLENENALQRLSFTSSLLGMSSNEYKIKLRGVHQVGNAGIAIMASLLLANQDSRITKEHVTEALRLASWPGRFEEITVKGQRILIDGAHNPAGMQALRQSLDFYYGEEGKQRVLLLGMLKDKDVEEMLKDILRPDDIVVLTAVDSPRSMRPEDMVSIAKRYSWQVEGTASRLEALDRAKALAAGEHLLVIAGSLYLIGELRSKLLGEV